MIMDKYAIKSRIVMIKPVLITTVMLTVLAGFLLYPVLAQESLILVQTDDDNYDFLQRYL